MSTGTDDAEAIRRARESFLRAGSNGQVPGPLPCEPGETSYRTEGLGEVACRATQQRWFVRGVVPDDSVVAVFGASGSGKTFLTLDMLCDIAASLSHWCGHRVTGAPVMLVTLEGEAGLAKRAKAWQMHTGRVYPPTLRVLRNQPFDLRSPADLQSLIERCHADGVLDGIVAIDTFNRASPSADENSGADMGQLILACSEIKRQLGGSVLLVCHSGKDGSKGIRGHSSLHAALDASIEVTRGEDDVRLWRVVKAKDDADGIEHPFRLKVIEVGVDDDGEAVTSCVIEPLDDDAMRPHRPMPRGSAQIIVYRVIGEMLRESREFGRGGAPPTRPCVNLEAAVDQAAQHMVCEPKNRKYLARRTVAAMIAQRIYSASGEWLWCA